MTWEDEKGLKLMPSTRKTLVRFLQYNADG